MILEIAELGAIKKMKLDLSNNFILFCGPNSTGKTYASYILNAFLSERYKLKDIDCFNIISEGLRKYRQFKLSIEYFDELMKKICDDIKSQLGDIFGISEKTKENIFENFSMKVMLSDYDLKKVLDNTIDFNFIIGEEKINITKKKGDDTIRCQYVSGNFFGVTTFELPNYNIALHIIFLSLLFRERSYPRMLTVERNSIYTFKTELSLSRNELVDRLQMDNIQSDNDILRLVRSSSRRYPMAVSESLRVANDLETIQKKEGYYAYIADEIEHDLLKGKVSTTKNGDVEFSSETMADSKRLPFHLSSSIVKTMASLVIYLRHIASKGDTLIVDEPEMNFHPDVQVILARIFARLSNDGLRVVVSTHSDYIIREVNNMIMAGVLYDRDKGKAAEESGYTREYSLDKKSVEVIYFNPNPETGYVETQSLPIDDEGFEVSSIDKTVVEQNQRMESLYESLYE